jgi:hypothetical protein
MSRRTLGLLAVAAMAASSSAQAQLTSADNGAAATDGNGLMWANTVGINLGWSPLSVYTDTAQAWVANLNSSGYGGYHDWTFATINQLGELFYSDCGNSVGAATRVNNPGKSCTALSTLSSAINIGTMGASGDINISSSTSLGIVPCCGYYSWSVYATTDSSVRGWDADTSNNGVVGRGDVLAVRATPEIDPASAASGLTLLLGGLAVLRGRRRVVAWASKPYFNAPRRRSTIEILRALAIDLRTKIVGL